MWWPIPNKIKQHHGGDMRDLTRSFAAVVCCFAIAGFALGQESTPAKMPAQKSSSSNAAYIAKALTAAPPGDAKGADVARIDMYGNVQTVGGRKNGCTCRVMRNPIRCADANSGAYFGAAMKKQAR